MSGPVIHPSFWSTLLEVLFLIVLPLVIYYWPRSDKMKSQKLPDAQPREERAGYVTAKMERFEKPR